MERGRCRLESRPWAKIHAVRTFCSLEATSETLQQTEAQVVQVCMGSDILQVYIALHAIHMEIALLDLAVHEPFLDRLIVKQMRIATHHKSCPSAFLMVMVPRLQQWYYQMILCPYTTYPFTKRFF